MRDAIAADGILLYKSRGLPTALGYVDTAQELGRITPAQAIDIQNMLRRLAAEEKSE